MALHGPIWFVIGIALCLVEIFLPSFTVLWFGLAAIVVGVVTLAMPTISLTAQLGIWAVLTALFAIGWFRYIKPLVHDRTKAGLSREAAVGQVGTIVKAGTDDVRGNVRFSVPLLGTDEWPYICETPLAVGDRCRVIDILGNALLVEKH